MRKSREATRAVRETVKEANLHEESLTEYTIVGTSVHLSGQYLACARAERLELTYIRHGVWALPLVEFNHLLAQLGERNHVQEFIRKS